MENNEIINIVINVDQASANLAELNKNLENNKNTLKEIEKSQGKSSAEYQKQAAVVKNLSKEYSEQSRLLQLSINADKAKTGSIEQLRSELSIVTTQWNKLSQEERENTESGRALTKQKTDLTKSLQAVEKATGDGRRSVGLYENATEELVKQNINLKAELRNIVKEMQNLHASGQENSQQYKDLALKAGQYRDSLDAVNDQVKTLATGSKLEAGLKTAKGAFDLAGGAAQIYEGSLAALGVENENVERSIQKLVAIQSVMNGVDAVFNALKKEGAVVTALLTAKTWLLTAAQKAYTIAVGTSTGAMKGLKAAMISSGIGALIVGLGFLVSKVVEYVEETDKASDAMDKQKEKITTLKESIKEFSKEYVEAMKNARESQKKLLEEQGKLGDVFVMNLEDATKELDKQTTSYNKLLDDQKAARLAINLYQDKLNKADNSADIQKYTNLVNNYKLEWKNLDMKKNAVGETIKDLKNEKEIAEINEKERIAKENQARAQAKLNEELYKNQKIIDGLYELETGLSVELLNKKLELIKKEEDESIKAIENQNAIELDTMRKAGETETSITTEKINQDLELRKIKDENENKHTELRLKNIELVYNREKARLDKKLLDTEDTYRKTIETINKLPTATIKDLGPAIINPSDPSQNTNGKLPDTSEVESFLQIGVRDILKDAAQSKLNELYKLKEGQTSIIDLPYDNNLTVPKTKIDAVYKYASIRQDILNEQYKIGKKNIEDTTKTAKEMTEKLFVLNEQYKEQTIDNLYQIQDAVIDINNDTTYLDEKIKKQEENIKELESNANNEISSFAELQERKLKLLDEYYIKEGLMREKQYKENKKTIDESLIENQRLYDEKKRDETTYNAIKDLLYEYRRKNEKLRDEGEKKDLKQKEKARLDIIKQTELDTLNARLEIANAGTSILMNLNDALFGHNERNARKHFEINKALGIGEAVINTASGVIAALSNTSDTIPTYLKFINAGVVATTGAAQIAKISATQYKGGTNSSNSTPSKPNYSMNVATGIATSQSKVSKPTAEKQQVAVVVDDVTAKQKIQDTIQVKSSI